MMEEVKQLCFYPLCYHYLPTDMYCVNYNSVVTEE